MNFHSSATALTDDLKTEIDPITVTIVYYALQLLFKAWQVCGNEESVAEYLTSCDTSIPYAKAVRAYRRSARHHGVRLSEDQLHKAAMGTLFHVKYVPEAVLTELSLLPPIAESI